VVFVLQADSSGEGGTFALLTLLRKGMLTESSSPMHSATASRARCQQAPRSPLPLLTSDTYGTSDEKAASTNQPQTHTTVRQYGHLTILSFVAAGLLLGDGILTPAISILSAMEGLVVVAPTLSGAVVPCSMIIILALFLAQRFGTSRVAAVFSPVMLVWSSGGWAMPASTSTIQASEDAHAL
jgi:K+ transporter